MHYGKIRGHEEILSRLSDNILHNRFEGVYLFDGPVSVGKFTIARRTSRYLLCTGEKDDTCMCSSCRLFPHVPDYLEISKEDENIKTVDIETVPEFFSLMPFQSDRRVLLIDNADRLYRTVSNRFLKILEDLQSNCVVFLITSKKHKMFPAILSRSYHVEFHGLRPDDIKSILKNQGYNTSGFEEIRKLIPYLQRNILHEYPQYMEIIKKVPKFLKDFPRMSEDEMLSSLKAYNDQDLLLHFVDLIVANLNDILKTKFDSPDVVFNTAQIDYYEQMTGVWSQDLCIMALDKLKNSMMVYNSGLNLKFLQYITPVFSWIYVFMRQEIAKKK